MHQVLFNIPVLKGWFPPDGIPVYGFGAMLFVAFVVCTMWATRRGKAVGMPGERLQDMVIWLFVSGFIGARVLYMVQYAHQFPDKDIGAVAASFFQIWKGGIVFYGSALGGVIGYGLFYWFVLRKLPVQPWQLADAVAPVLALGLAIGRIGCYLNGCCWGQVAVEGACPVPLGAAHMPLLPAHAREQLVREQLLQTSTGFTVAPRERGLLGADPRTVVGAVEPGSPAEAAGLKAGDRITGVNGQKNTFVVEVLGNGEKRQKAVEELRRAGGAIEEGGPDRTPRVVFDDLDILHGAVDATRRAVPGVSLIEGDGLGELVRDWPRGKHDLALTVLRNGKEVPISPFVPRTVSLYPTQLYETISMILLIFVLLAYYPFRRHDGQLMVLCMIGYAVHRFINESLRIEPAYGLSAVEWLTVAAVAAAAVVGAVMVARVPPGRRWVSALKLLGVIVAGVAFFVVYRSKVGPFVPQVGPWLTISQWGSVVILVAAVGIEAYLWRVMPSRWARLPLAASPPAVAKPQPALAPTPAAR